VRYELRLTADESERFREASARRGMSPASLIRSLITEEWLMQQEREARLRAAVDSREEWVV